MPSIHISGLPSVVGQKVLNSITGSIKDAVAKLDYLHITADSIRVHFHADLGMKTLGGPIDISVEDLFKRPERGKVGLNALAQAIGEVVQTIFPLSRIVCVVNTIDPTAGYAELTPMPAGTQQAAILPRPEELNQGPELPTCSCGSILIVSGNGFKCLNCGAEKTGSVTLVQRIAAFGSPPCPECGALMIAADHRYFCVNCTKFVEACPRCSAPLKGIAQEQRCTACTYKAPA